MKQEPALSQILKETGIPDDMILKYQSYLETENRQGQKRLLCQFRRIQNDTLKRDRERLACLDFIIAKVEKTQDLLERN